MSDERAAELLRGHRPCVHELYAAGSQTVCIGGVHILVAVAAEFVSTGIFEGEPENIWGLSFFLVVCRIRLGGMQPAESGTHE